MHRQQRSGFSRIQSIGLGLVVAGSLIAVFLAVNLGGPKIGDSTETLPDLGPAPAWALTDRNGQPFTQDAVAGQPYIALFYFLQCRGICPAMLGKMKQLETTIAASALNGQAKIVGMSIDGPRDTPEAITAYYDTMQLDPAVTELLTGEQQTVWSIAEDGFKLPTSHNAPDAEGKLALGMEYLHSGRFTLVDAEGRIRGYYDHESDQALQQLLNDLHRLTH